jgi:hypothetical protein
VVVCCQIRYCFSCVNTHHVYPTNLIYQVFLPDNVRMNGVRRYLSLLHGISDEAIQLQTATNEIMTDDSYLMDYPCPSIITAVNLQSKLRSITLDRIMEQLINTPIESATMRSLTTLLSIKPLASILLDYALDSSFLRPIPELHRPPVGGLTKVKPVIKPPIGVDTLPNQPKNHLLTTSNIKMDTVYWHDDWKGFTRDEVQSVPHGLESFVKLITS